MAFQRHGIRANLAANKEDRTSHRNRAVRESFGVYRPLTAESSRQMWEVIGQAKEEIAEYFVEYRNSPAELVVPTEMGVTFVTRREVGRKMRKGMLERFELVELGRQLERIESGAEKPELEVPLSHTDWFSHEERKLVYRFADSEQNDQLALQAELIGQAMSAASAGEVPVHEPSHVTLFKYGRARDGNNLSYDHKHEIGKIVERHFAEAEIGSVVLSGLIIGDSYTRPKEIFNA